MPCEYYIDLILESLDGGLDLKKQRELTDHIETCECCRSLYHTYHNIDEAVSSMEDPPEELKRSVMEAISRENGNKRKRMLKRYRFTAIAACAAIAVILAGRTLPSFSHTTADTANNGVLAADNVAEAEGATFASAKGVQEAPETMEEISKGVAAYDGGGASETVYVELSEAGYTGKLLVITPEQETIVADSEVIEISSGYVVYHISADAFQNIQEKIGSYEELLLPGDDTGDVYIMIE